MALEEAKTPAELLRMMTVDGTNAKDAADPKKIKEDLGLSGNVISATFCVPSKIGYQHDHTWRIDSRRGTSALFDSLSYLKSPESEWRHTLVGWTGEIDRIPEQELGINNDPTRAASNYDLSTSIDMHRYFRTAHNDTTSDLHISAQQKDDLKLHLEQTHGGRVAPVWLSDEDHEDGSITLRDQHKWRRYGEHEIFTLFHYKQNEPSDGQESKKAWKNYERMNEAFADAIMAVYSPGDLVIVHDYHLMLLPNLLRQRIPNIYIGFFLHIPFPSSEYYRCLSRRQDILQGLLGANMIGFQQHGYLRHFASCCHRLLGFETSHASIEAYGTHVGTESMPIGINAKATEQAAFTSEIDDKIAEVLGSGVYEGKHIIIGRDRLDSVRGVAQKLQAFEIFLEKYPQWRDKVVLFQVTSPTSIEDRDDKNSKTEHKIMELVIRINSKFGSITPPYNPVQYYPQYISKATYFALLRIADVGLITSVRDGMNTTALEYVVCQRDKHGSLILSEFSGTAGSLEDAILINPWDFTGVAAAIGDALTMTGEQRAESHRKLYDHVNKNNVKQWTNKYITRLLTNIKLFNKAVATPLLDRTKMLAQHANSTNRLFMFDYDGTLTPIVKEPRDAIPSDRVIRTLKALSKDPKNAVWIVSGRDQSFLEEYMGHIPALGLSAEHGSFVRKPDAQEWENMTKDMDLSWHAPVLKIFGQYTKNPEGGFNGTHIEQKRIALTWHYRRTDPAWGAQAARMCRKQLQDEIEPFYAVDVMKGKMNLEVRPRFVNKGEIAKRLVKAYQEEPDFVLCMGDDHTDEDMFRSLRSSKLPDENVFAVTVGASSKQTLASWHVSEPSDVISALESLNSAAVTAGKLKPAAAANGDTASS